MPPSTVPCASIRAGSPVDAIVKDAVPVGACPAPTTSLPCTTVVPWGPLLTDVAVIRLRISERFEAVVMPSAKEVYTPADAGTDTHFPASRMATALGAPRALTMALLFPLKYTTPWTRRRVDTAEPWVIC